MGPRPIYCPRCGSKRIEQSQEGKSPYRCMECRNRFGDAEEASDYASRLVKFSIEIRGLSGAVLYVRLFRDGEKYSYLVRVGKERGREGKVDERFWKDFSERLFSSWSFHKWSESYFGTDVSELMAWDAEASFERKHTISVHGFNNRPVHWTALVESLFPVLEGCGLRVALHPTFSLEKI